MRPPSFISGSRRCVRKNTPLRCTLTSASNCASVVSVMGACTPMPALLTRKSNRSRCQWQSHSTAAQLFDVGHHCLGFGGLLAVGQHHVDAAVCSGQRCAAAQAAAAAGDQNDGGGG